MPVHIIIDGYNLIRQSSSLGRLDQMDLQLGRDALIDHLAAYKRLKKHKITVVFDGSEAFSFFGDKASERGITIKFSRQGESADSVIKRMAAREKEKALVVSSDLEVIDYAVSMGAVGIGSEAFEEKMTMAAFMEAKGVTREAGPDEGWVPTTKKKGPHKRLSKNERVRRKKLKKL